MATNRTARTTQRTTRTAPAPVKRTTTKPAAAKAPAAPKPEPKEPTVTPTATAPAIPSKFIREETPLPASTRGNRALDNDLLAVLKLSYDEKANFSLAVDDTPEVTRNGATRRDATTAEQYIRRHAAHLGYGVKIREDKNTGRIHFVAGDKKKVPTLAEGRKPRTPKATEQ